MAALTFCFVTAANQMLDRRMWKKLVRAMLVTGDLTCCRAWITFTRNASTALRLKKEWIEGKKVLESKYTILEVQMVIKYKIIVLNLFDYLHPLSKHQIILACVSSVMKKYKWISITDPMWPQLLFYKHIFDDWLQYQNNFIFPWSIRSLECQFLHGIFQGYGVT